VAEDALPCLTGLAGQNERLASAASPQASLNTASSRFHVVGHLANWTSRPDDRHVGQAASYAVIPLAGHMAAAARAAAAQVVALDPGSLGPGPEQRGPVAAAGVDVPGHVQPSFRFPLPDSG
jgi:hypothetical protein